MLDLINTIFGIPLGYLMYFAFKLVKDYGLSIIIFTFFTKVIMFPLTLISQKNSIKMVKIQPQLDEIKERYAGDAQQILAEQKKLYKEEKYSSAAGMLPLLFQIPIILGLINVIYNPLQHLLHLDAELIAGLTRRAGEVLSLMPAGVGAQIEVLNAIRTSPEAFASLLQGSGVLAEIKALDFFFLGLNLAEKPLWSNITVLVPILSGLSSFLLSALQNRHNVLQREQGFLGRWGTAAFLVAFSTYFASIVPMGIGLYWIVGNYLSIPVLFLANLIYNPKRLIDYENRPQKQKLTAEERKLQREVKRKNKAREKIDVNRFFSREKKLVFYSESSGFYKYFGRIIEYILEESDLDIHYVTSDPKDKIFENKNPRLHSYYVGPTKLISFMMKMDADMVIMTMPDLDRYHIKRSIVKKDVEYVYLDHAMTSFHLMLREHALDAFDTIFVNGPNHIEEVRQTEDVYGLKEKRLIKTGYSLLDELLESVKNLPEIKRDKKHVLIAPSWQKDNLLEFCLEELLEQMLHKGYKLILRPHPEFIKRFPAKMQAIYDRYADDLGEDFEIEDDFSSNTNIYTSDLVVTDWSAIAQEFSYATKKPSLFINTPMKMMNPNYKKIKAVPLNISLRDEIGVSVDIEDFEKLPKIIDDLLNRPDFYREKITQVVEDNIYNIGRAAEASGQYIIGRLGGDERSEDETP
ncbi:MAG: membrane protein insertase YidC [Clostridiales bacterium]|nr:membrane protein insertase YidC [Clostridiales bacterium]